MNRSKPRPPQTAPNVMNNELNACAVDLPGRQKHSDQFLFSRGACAIDLPGSQNIHSIVLLWRLRGLFCWSPPPVAWCCCFSFSFCDVLPFFLSSVGWCCLVFLHQVVLLFFPLQLGGAACFPPPLGGVAFRLLLWVELLCSSLRWGGAAWSPPSLGGVAFHLFFEVVLLSFPSFGSYYIQIVMPSFPSSGWGCFFTLLFCWVVLLGSFGWCCCFTFFCWVT